MAEVPSLPNSEPETQLANDDSPDAEETGFSGQIEDEFFLSSDSYSPHLNHEIVASNHGVLNADSLELLESEVSLNNAPNYLGEIFDQSVVQSMDTNDYRPGAVKCAVAEVSSFESESVDAVAEIDKKIDASLELAERMRTPQRMGETDNLEVPAFLRHGMRDLPLD